MLVYRIEHPEYNTGPYCQCDLQDKNAEAAALASEMGNDHSDGTHPVAWLSFSLSWEQKQLHRCGCSHKAKLVDWFKGWGERLRDAGFVVRKFRVPRRDVQDLGRQLIFRAENAVQISELAIDFA